MVGVIVGGRIGWGTDQHTKTCSKGKAMSDDKPLWERMREAADTLVEASFRYTGCSEAEADQMTRESWCAGKLRQWADIWEEGEAAAREALVAAIVQVLHESNKANGYSAADHARAILEQFDITPKAPS